MKESTTDIFLENSNEKGGWRPEPGMKVLVKIGDCLESGWQLDDVISTNQALVSKIGDSGEKELTTTASLENLRRINQVGGVDFLEAKNLNDLQILIIKNGPVHGSKKDYSEQEIMDLVHSIMTRNDQPLELLPSAGGLREAVRLIFSAREKGAGLGLGDGGLPDSDKDGWFPYDKNTI
jgi:hypothetical protein